MLGTYATGYSRIWRANSRINFAIAGVNGRGIAHLEAILQMDNCEITHICDVDSRAMEKAIEMVRKATGKAPKGEKDFRKLMEIKDIDAVTIATPEHWHAPMAIMALQAGKHVYVEKPCAHNPAEAEMLPLAQKKYGKLVQMGNQQRSGVTSQQAMKDLREGIIGEVHFGKAWYANKRGAIGVGKPAAVPNWLDWDLWQGPAPRREYRDNIVHYNWHWFKHWGTGELHNNGTHEIDICRWALGVDFPEKVTSAGGRYFFQDDWEFPDTQIVNFEFGGGKLITWEGRSCAPEGFYGEGRGVTLHGSKGHIFLTRNGYKAYDNNGKEIKKLDEAALSATTDTRGIGSLDVLHFENFTRGIRDGEVLNAPIKDAYRSTMLCHLGNLAQFHGGALQIDPANGHVIGNKAAMKEWGREYEKGWEVKV